MSAQASILVVDDEPGILEFLRFVLQDYGYHVYTARNGLEALTSIQQDRPDVVLTDLMMPGLDGWGLVTRLRQDALTRTLPIVGMSAVDPNQVQLDAFLRKPFEIDDMLGVLCSVTRIHTVAQPE